MEPAAVDRKPEVFSYADGGEVTGCGLRRVHLRIATRPAVCKCADAAGADDSNCAEVVVPIRLGKSRRDHAARTATLRTDSSSRFDGRRSSTHGPYLARLRDKLHA
jgi:hypothetical protein